MRVLAAISIVLGTLLGGCLTDEPVDTEVPPGPTPSSDVTLAGGKVLMDVPVPVFLVGFAQNMADQLQGELEPMVLASSGALKPTAKFTVHTPSSEWQTAFDQFLSEATHAGNAELTGFNGAVLDGNAIEAYLAEHLDEVASVPDGITSLVIMDPGVRGHAYHYEGNVGWREPVRVFGEHDALLVWDPHADEDPWVGPSILHTPVADATASHLAAWVTRATAIRALQMPIWPTATETCHALTIVLAVRGTTATPAALGLQSWDEALNVPALQATFQNLTGDPVFVDLVVKQLPQDDAVLEALTRENGARAITQTYLDLNFDSYHVAHDNCEPYLSLVVYGDLADQRTQSNGNAVMMGASGNRISTSLVAENVRVMSEVVGYQQQWDESTNFERVGPGASPLEWFNWVVAHESGHLFSLPHPNYSTGDQSFSDAGFASTWNVMGYQMRRIVTETSEVDANNMQRNQAAYALLDAEGVSEEAMDAALVAMGEYRWKDATRALET